MNINELAQKTGVPRRNIRFLVAEGVVPEPLSKGRGASYGPEHLKALKIYAKLKSKGVTSLDVIRDAVERGSVPTTSTVAAAPASSVVKTIVPCPGIELKVDVRQLREINIADLIYKIENE